MRKVLLVLAFLSNCISHSFAGSVPTVELLWKGQTRSFYNVATNEQQQKIVALLQRNQFAEKMASVGQRLRLRHDIAVGIESCGKPNAFFDPSRQSVVICTEFVELVVRQMRADSMLMSKLNESQRSTWATSILWGVYFHELAHALIHVNRIPFAGREEDVADQFALWYGINFSYNPSYPVIPSVIWFWHALAGQRNVSGMSDGALQLVLANEHSLDDQRTYNMACWALGARTDQAAVIAQGIGLPDSRAMRCPNEYAQLNAAMRNQFVKYIKAN